MTELGDVVKRNSERSVISTWLTRLCVGFLALTIAGATAGVFGNTKTNGELWFFLWDFFSRASHGGDHIVVGNVSIYYEVFGSGPPVLVLHGGLGSLVDMRHQIESLAKNHLVIAPDSRGHGRSTDSAGPLSYAEMAEDVHALLDRLAIRKADIVGWSDGGIIGLTLALRYPERVGRLVVIGANFDPAGLVSPPLPDPPIPSAPRLYRWIAPDPAHWPVLYRKVTAMWRTQPHFTLDELGRIRSPTLVIAGEFDAVQRAHTDTLAAAIPNAREYIIPGATHQAPVTHPAAVNAQILGFLDGSGR